MSSYIYYTNKYGRAPSKPGDAGPLGAEDELVKEERVQLGVEGVDGDVVPAAKIFVVVGDGHVDGGLGVTFEDALSSSLDHACDQRWGVGGSGDRQVGQRIAAEPADESNSDAHESAFRRGRFEQNYS